MKITAKIQNAHGQNELIVGTNSITKTLQIPAKESGSGSAVNGGELLLSALAVCYCNDIYREAAKLGVQVESVTVEVSAEFGAEGEPGRKFSYRPVIKSNGTQQQVDELIDRTDKVAEIHNTLRQGVEVTLVR